MQTIEASNGHWERIYQQLNLPPITGNSHYKGECPICGRKGKFRADDRNGDGDWICVCDNGKGLKLIQEVFQIGFDEACKMVDDIIGNVQEPRHNIQGFKSDSDLAEEKFAKLKYIQGGSAEADYFLMRGIHDLPSPNAVRWSYNEEYDHASKMHFPAIVAKVQSHTGRYVYEHHTYIVQGKKIGIDPARKMYSKSSDVKGAACRLYPKGKVLGVAEGIETACSATQMYGVPTWATINTTLMKKFVCPNGVDKLIIFADNDPNLSGVAAAFECARRNMLARNELRQINVVWPETTGHDFNDALLKNDFKTVIHKFHRT